ncbi:IS66 family insertion sequence element accessory protein TnpB, partial [Cesiribacter sp. SM1]|uniref:IS66 family insertion sequence element accessory protein TnpB n=1 Tax=Cesiribacter sp. SM1 TaxID=2861196 RepID=UPI0021041755
MRKSFDALSGLVRNELQRDPASGGVYVFVNRSRNCIKLLHWESGGFVLYRDFYGSIKRSCIDFFIFSVVSDAGKDSVNDLVSNCIEYSHFA